MRRSSATMFFEWPCAESSTMASTSRRRAHPRSIESAVTPTPAATRRRPFAVLAGVGVVLYFGDVLIGNQSDEFPSLSTTGSFSILLLSSTSAAWAQLRRMGGDEVLLRSSPPRNAAVHVALETQVAVGDDADQGRSARRSRGCRRSCSPASARGRRPRCAPLEMVIGS